MKTSLFRRSPWSSPVVLVKRKNEGYRFCIDFRMVNSVMLEDAYPLPQINPTLDKLRNARYFLSIDLENGQVPIDPASQEITAFTVTGRGLFHFKVMSLGLYSASSTFQRFLDQVVDVDFDDRVFVYLDDIIISDVIPEKHVKMVEIMLQRPYDAASKIND